MKRHIVLFVDSSIVCFLVLKLAILEYEVLCGVRNLLWDTEWQVWDIQDNPSKEATSFLIQNKANKVKGLQSRLQYVPLLSQPKIHRVYDSSEAYQPEHTFLLLQYKLNRVADCRQRTLRGQQDDPHPLQPYVTTIHTLEVLGYQLHI